MNNLEKIRKIQTESNKILNVLKNGNQNYIFGCGWMGKKFSDVLNLMHIDLNGFVVTVKSDNMYNNIPIYSSDEIKSGRQNKNIFIALRDQDKRLAEELEKEFNEVVTINYPNTITCIEARFYFDYLSEKGVNCNNELIGLSGFTFINPFLKNDDYLLAWVYEAGDLLLPNLFNDSIRIDEGPYEYENIKLQEGDVVFDCGTNIGLFSSVALQKGCIVYGFEPMPDAISYLEELKKLEYGKEFTICPFALSKENGTAVFHIQNHDLLGASLFENHNRIDVDINIHIVTIDSYVKENEISRVDFIKADIEGSERDMIMGASDTIKKYHPKLSICTYHLDDDKEVLENIIHNIEPQYIIEHRWKKLYAYVPKNL